MKKYIYLLSVILLFFVSCGNKHNYEMRSEMNNLYPIEIVYFDFDSRKELGDFPINRGIYGELIDEIEKDRPAFIILKFFFDTEKDEDFELSNILSKYDNILNQATTGLEQVNVTPDSVLSILAIDGIDIKIMNSNQIVLPNSQLFHSFSGIGMVDFKSRNGKYLDFPIMSQINGYYLPSLALKIGMMISNSEPVIKDDVVFLDNKEIVDSSGNFRIDLSSPKEFYNTHSFIEVLHRKQGAMDFSEKIVILFIEDPSVRKVKSKYKGLHNNAEIVADSINTLLKKLE